MSRPFPENAGPARNDLSGVVHGPSVQAQQIRGGVHFHAVPRPLLVPRQSAAANANFAGRSAELAQLDAAASGPGPAVVVLSGPAGVGKTALAWRWADAHKQNFPHGQLALDLSGFGPVPPLDPAAALRILLRGLAPYGDALPAGLADLTALYRSHTAERSLLLILDDAYSAAQVRVLVPASATSMTIVTSRKHLSSLMADGAALITVPPMSSTDSLDLLTGILGAPRVVCERAQAERVASLCGGLPIALCLVAARLATRPQLTIAGVVRALDDEATRLSRLVTPDAEVSVSGAFEMSYLSLNNGVAALYRALSLHPGGEFSAGLVATVVSVLRAAGVSAGAGELLDGLLEANLVQEVAEDRYRFHDLVRMHARHKASADDATAARDAALLAMLEWYLGAASRADLVATPYRRRFGYAFRTSPSGLPAFSGRDQALAWLDQERASLGAACKAALAQGWAELAFQLADVLWPLQLYRKSSDRLEIDQQGLAAARQLSNPGAESRMRKRLGRTLTTLREYDRAEHHLRAAIETAVLAGDGEGRVEAEEMLALLFSDSGRLEEAVNALERVLDARRRFGDSRSIGLSLIALGTVQSCCGRYAEAIEALREAGELLTLSADIDAYNPIRVKAGLARAYLGAGALDEAQRFAAEALKGMRTLGVVSEEADAWELTGVIAVRRGDHEKGRNALQRAMAILIGLGSPRAAGLRRKLAELPAAGDLPGAAQPIGE
ncbi:hypothetical protein Asp14428_35410 [Actinoplanes sp. NBRC 14428]|nr:hypothetical protein Asp14428_35410 [Actinoplanes sp. NBRC 14428]